MNRVLRKEQLLTIPNLLSVVRLALIPLILWLYCAKEAYTLAVVVILLSGLTDVVDGWIARRFHMVSDFGKILDPVADKLTQLAVLICLTVKHRLMLLLIVLFVVAECVKLLLGYLTIRRKDSVNSAQWHGKLNTVVLYVSMILLILFPGMSDWAANGLILLCALVMLFSFVRYVLFYRRLLRKEEK